jgi:nucleotide-binding universal stress UspA family protein
MYGSVTERVIKTVHTPIIVVPPGGDVIPSTIVMSFDFSAPSKRAAEVARAIHGVFHGPLHMVHCYLDVWGEYTDRGAVVGEAAEKRREALHLGLEEMLETEAKELFGTTGKSGIERLLIGSVARRLLHDSKVPLLLTHDDAP